MNCLIMTPACVDMNNNLKKTIVILVAMQTGINSLWDTRIANVPLN